MVETIVVLHVDDEPDFAELTADLLERADDRIEVVTETSVEAGFERLKDGEIDCVVSDYDMPGLDGLEFLEHAREVDPDVPFVLFTGKGSEEVASKALSKGATDYLQKQVRSDQAALLANRVVNYVETARTEAQRERNLQAIETAKEGIAILDEKGEFLFVNESCAELYGYEPAELVGETWELIHSDDEIERLTAEIVPTLLEEGEWHGDSLGLRADGTTFVGDHTLSRTAQGEFVCSIRDATGSRERQQYEAIFEAMGDGVYALDAEGRVIEANESMVELLGVPYDEVVGKDASGFYDDADVEAFEAAIRHLLSEEETSVSTVEARLRRLGGEVVPIEVTLTLLPSDDGEFRGTVGVIRDVTERREREQELERYETLLELMPDSVVVTDMEGTVVDIHGYEGWSGYGYDELVGEHMSKTMREADVERAEEIVSGLVTSEERSKATYEQQTVTKDGVLIPHENHITLLPPDEDGRIPGTMSVLRDITERVERERALQRQNERLEEFAGIVSHDLRNPLSVAAGRLALAREERDSEHLEAVARSHDRMSVLIENLLELARQSEPVGDRESVVLGDLIEEAWNHVETADATLHVDVDRSVSADESRLKQLLENLLRNAVEHGSTSPRSSSTHEHAVGREPPDEPSVADACEDAVELGGESVTIRISELADGAGIFVADDGPGIPPDEREAVFESGYTTSPDGTGFGLSIVREVATAHGWEVSVTDAETGGARFEIVWHDEE